MLLVARGKDPVIVLPELESPKVNLFPYKVNAFTYGENPSEWDAVFRKAIQSLGLDGKKIGVEPRQLRLLEFQYMRGGAPEADFPDASEALASLRLRKDDSEVDAMKQAVKVAQVALEATIPLIKIGMTEKEIASELTLQMLKHGSESELPFPPIVSVWTEFCKSTCFALGSKTSTRRFVGCGLGGNGGWLYLGFDAHVRSGGSRTGVHENRGDCVESQ